MTNPYIKHIPYIEHINQIPKTIAMKNQNKHIALEDTRSGDVMGGCYGNRGEFFRRFFIFKGGVS